MACIKEAYGIYVGDAVVISSKNVNKIKKFIPELVNHVKKFNSVTGIVTGISKFDNALPKGYPKEIAYSLNITMFGGTKHIANNTCEATITSIKMPALFVKLVKKSRREWWK